LQKQKKDLADAYKEKELAKKQLEEETVMRVDTENRLQSLKEQMKFNQAIHEQVSLGKAESLMFYKILGRARDERTP
jgi:hypothetical protein